jgi:D-threo-aldose 1-dehydrogenase
VGQIIAGSGTWVPWNPEAAGKSASEPATQALIERLFANPLVRGIDTANNYGLGETERRIGRAIHRAGGVPDGFRIQTKADRDMATGDFSGARVRASLEESRRRLGLDTLPVVYLHDPENISWADAFAADGPVAALVEARRQGRIAVLGVAGAPSALLARYLRTGHFTSVITHNRYTLVDRSSDRLLSLAAELGVEALNASPYGGGFLTAWPPPSSRYAYGEAHPALRDAASRAARLCADHGVPLVAAALAFSLREPRIAATVVGMQDVDDLAATERVAGTPVPAALLGRLADLELDPRSWQDPTDDLQL